MKNLILAGFMGTGKSAVGRLLAERLNRRFVDLDEDIEKREKRPIYQIFKESGEPYFRGIEKEAVKEVSQLKDCIIAVGGGAIVDPENLAAFKKNGIVICLLASVDAILERTKDNPTRPLLNVPDPRKRVEELLKFRAPYYAKTDYQIDTTDLSVEEVAEKILEILKEISKEPS